MDDQETKPPALPMNREKKSEHFILGYMDLIDFECEIGAKRGGNLVFASPEDCRDHRKCVGECGIVEVKVEATRIVQASKMYETYAREKARTRRIAKLED